MDWKTILTALLIILVGSACYALGTISRIFEAREPITIEYNDPLTAPSTPTQTASAIQSEIAEPVAKKVYVGAKTGTKYYLPSCTGVSRIKEENKVWFATTEEAKARGYSAASNCKGL